MAMRTLTFSMILLSLAYGAAAESAMATTTVTTNTWAARASVAELMEKIRNDERWIWKARSVQIESETHWVRAPAAADKKRQSESGEFGSRLARDDRDEIRGKERIAWDEQRIAVTTDDDRYSGHRFFDGKQNLSHSQTTRNNQETFAINLPSPKNFDNALAGLGIGRSSYPNTWWRRQDKEDARSYNEPPLARIKDLGIRARDQRHYRVLRTTGNNNQAYWIDLESGRLAFLQILHSFGPDNPNDPKAMEDLKRRIIDLYNDALITDPEDRAKVRKTIEAQRRSDPRWMERYEEIISRGAKNIEPGKNEEKETINLWIDALREMKVLGPETERVRAEVLKRLERGEHPLMDARNSSLEDDEKPVTEFTFADWRDVGGGRFFPFQQDYTMWSTMHEDYGEKKGVRHVRITRLEIDRPLPEDMFRMEFKEGAAVIDWSHRPPLEYQYKKHIARAEWEKIYAAAEKKRYIVEDIKNEQKAMIGAAAPEIQAGCWLNGRAVSMKEFRGKYVILYFFAEWCDPGVDNTTRLVELAKDFDEKRVVIVGIHAARSKDEDIRTYLDLKGVRFPVAVDRPRGGAWAFGETFGRYKVTMVPHAVLVDEAGMILAHGTQDQVLEILNRLVPNKSAPQKSSGVGVEDL